MATVGIATPCAVHSAPYGPTQEPVIVPPSQTINILLTSFAGLGLPRTLSLPITASTSICDVVKTILERLPRIDHKLIIATTSNKQLLSSDTAPASTLLLTPTDTFLPLRLSARLCGGKGGFGSQLRAAGGRMSSRKNRQNQQNVNGSNRNLDGRRLRTVDEAKRLADYLAIKPEMEKKEKEERKKRWEAVVAASERREEEIKSGKSRSNQGRLDADYVEGKEMAEEKTREAVLKAMREGMIGIERTGSESSADAEGNESEEDDEARSSESSEDGKAVEEEAASGRTFFGWDDDDDDDEDGDEENEDKPAIEPPAYEGKGKDKAA